MRARWRGTAVRSASTLNPCSTGIRNPAGRAKLRAMHDLNGKTALVTGGTRGLGRAISRRLAAMGATVAMNYRRDEDSAASALEEVRAIAPRSILIKADLENDSEVRAMVARAASEFGKTDILIANAAATAFKPLLETKPHNIQRTFSLSVGGFVAAVQEVSRVMPDGGRVLMVSGIDSIRNLPGHGVLGAAKAALESMVRDFAFELGPRGITVNGLNVGYIDTDSAHFYTRYLGITWEEFKRRCEERSAMKRLPTLDEIAAVACLICLPEASYLTSQSIWVDGGFTLHFPGAE